MDIEKGLDNSEDPAENIFRDLVKAGQEKKERESEELARSFVEGGMWLARQSDPVRQFEDLVAVGLIRASFKRQQAQRQFDEIIQTGNTDASKAFEMFLMLTIAKINPNQFRDIIAEAQLQRDLKKTEARIKEFYKNNITPIYNEQDITNKKNLFNKSESLFSKDNPLIEYKFKNNDKLILNNNSFLNKLSENEKGKLLNLFKTDLADKDKIIKTNNDKKYLSDFSIAELKNIIKSKNNPERSK